MRANPTPACSAVPLTLPNSGSAYGLITPSLFHTIVSSLALSSVLKLKKYIPYSFSTPSFTPIIIKKIGSQSVQGVP